ncbi:hypothetical protein [Metapseudomonas furukawaii]|uniref:hypothetical protein n=1 Tax=Metapseudomonas furukawaii TaxID=1149133 RepID=UPI0009DA52D6|nr:hypothetical protein [Pseudomonas furukawaii]
MESEKNLTPKQAFCAMFYFLEHEYSLTKSDDIGAMLGSMDWTIWSDGAGPADPAAWEDWLDAVRKAQKDSPNW